MLFYLKKYTMKELILKDYEIIVLWKTIKYKQQSFYDCLDFSYKLQEKDFKLEDWLLDFLNKNGWVFDKKELIKIDFEKFLQVLFDTAFKGFFKKGKKGWKSYPYEWYLMLLAEKFSLDPDSIIRKYTPEQLEYYTEWIIYNTNEQSKEWQKRNKIDRQFKEMRKEESDEDALKRIKAFQKRKEEARKNKT